MWHNLALIAVIYLTIGLLLGGLWYGVWARVNRLRSRRIIQWITNSLGSRGAISNVQWISISCFQVILGIHEGCFHTARIIIRLSAREIPLKWFYRRKPQETATFEATLSSPPSFSMFVQTKRWIARTGKKNALKLKRYETEKLGSFAISSRPDWKKDIVNTMEMLSGAHDCEFVDVKFGSRAPHFVATVPLKVLDPANREGRPPIFDVLREIASDASTSKL